MAIAWVEVGGFRVRNEVRAGVRVAIAPVALEQVLVNLLLNARAAAGQEMVCVRVVSAGPQAVGIEVVDRGSGQHGGLFSDAAPAKRGGVGLVICRHLVDAVGGTLSARTEPGVGTTVRVELRRVAGAGKAAA